MSSKLKSILAGDQGPIMDFETLDLVQNALAMYAAIADDGGAQTDETTEANESTSDDMTLLPVTPAQEDAYYFGADQQFINLEVNVNQGAGTWVITWEYWDGDSWEALAGVSDGTTGFTTTGVNNVTFTLPTDWARNTVNSQGPFYYIRARVSDYTSVSIQPLGQQSRINNAGLDVLTTAGKFAVITCMVFVLRFADAAVEWAVFAAEASALTNGFYLQYSGEGLDTINAYKDNGDFFNMDYDVTLVKDAAGTPNQILVAHWKLKEAVLPWGLKMWDGETFGFKVQDDMTVLTSIDSFEVIVQGYRFPA